MAKQFSRITRLPEFEKDLKRLLKKYPTLEEDLATWSEKELFLCHRLGIDNGGVFRITGLGTESAAIFKGKKFACRSLKGRGVHSGIRVIYSYDAGEDSVDLLEIYFKGDKKSEDRERIKQYLAHRP